MFAEQLPDVVLFGEILGGYIALKYDLRNLSSQIEELKKQKVGGKK
jgi:hypothetical protein